MASSTGLKRALEPLYPRLPLGVKSGIPAKPDKPERRCAPVFLPLALKPHILRASSRPGDGQPAGRRSRDPPLVERLSMVHMLNPHATLIEKNCETIRAANRVALRETKPGMVRDAAKATIDSLETITEGLLDEEYAEVGRIKKMIAASGSLRLARHIADLNRQRLTYDPTTWRIVLLNTNPQRIRDLLAGPCRPHNLALGVLEQVHEGRMEYAALIDEVAPLDPFAKLDGTLIFDTRVPEHATRFLRLQVEAMPVRYEEMAEDMARQMAVDSLALLFLLGVRMPDPEVGFAESTLFLKAVSSNHGKMAAYAALGTIEDYLADPKRHLRSNRVAIQAA